MLHLNGSFRAHFPLFIIIISDMIVTSSDVIMFNENDSNKMVQYANHFSGTPSNQETKRIWLLS